MTGKGMPAPSSQPGPASTLRVSAPEVIGLDVGGTKLSAARLAGSELGEIATSPTERESTAKLLDALVAAVEELRGSGLAAVGVGVPSVIDSETGRARASVNVPLQDVPLRATLRERLGVPVYVENDATCAALAEAHADPDRVVRTLVMLTVGTGVGGGIVIGGRPYRGATGAAGELGHTLIGAELSAGAPEAGTFPQTGSLEALAAGRQLDHLAEQSAAAHPDSALGHAAAEGRAVLGREAVAAARAGDEAAARAVRTLAERLGIGIANAINTFDPEVVAIGGGVVAAGELLLEPAREVARRFTLPGVGTRTEIRLARFGADAGVRGAALLAAQELELEP